MNKKYCLIILLFLALIASCGKNDAPPAFQLPEGIYTINKVYDIDNTNSFADVRVELTALSTVNVADLVEARLVFSKATKTFTQDQISGLAPDSFFSIPIAAPGNQVIKPTSFKDADGDAIVNGVAYKIYIGVIGKQDAKQLSASKVFTLEDKPIYAGDYVGTWQDLGPPGPATFPMSLRIVEDYSGKMFYANSSFTPFGSGTQDATTTMQVNGTVITSFVLNQFILGYNGGCSATKTLTGNFNDDVNLVLDTFSWADCDGTRDVVLKFKKQ